jgi:hypothetical protein
MGPTGVAFFGGAEKISDPNRTIAPISHPRLILGGLMETIVMQEHSADGTGADFLEERMSRSRLIGGNPFAVGARRSFGKPAELIEIDFQDSRPTLVELKLYNVLLAESMRQLAADPERRSFAARAALLRRAIGQGAARSNARLRDALDRLRTPIRMPQLTNGFFPPLASWTMPDQESVSWRFEEVVRALLHHPQRWSWLDLDVCASFQRTASLLLYERLRLIANRRWPVLSIGIAELRGALGLADRMARGCDLLEKTLMPAIREIEKLCALSVSVRLEREPRHGTLTKLTFKLPLDGGKPSRRDLSVDSRVPALPGETAGQVRVPVRQVLPPLSSERTRSVPVTSSVSISSVKPSGFSPSPKAAIFKRGIEMFAAQGIGELAARSFLGGLVSKYDDGFVAVVLDQAWQRRETLADLRSWILRNLKRYPTREAQRTEGQNRRKGEAAPAKARPLATPEYLGISPGMQRKIQDQNRALAEFSIFDPKPMLPTKTNLGENSDPLASGARSSAIDVNGGGE